MRDPEGFAAQELRRQKFVEMKRKGEIPKVSVALQVLQCKMFLDSENELFYDDPYDAGYPTASWSLDHGAELSVPQVAVFAIPNVNKQ